MHDDEDRVTLIRALLESDEELLALALGVMRQRERAEEAALARWVEE